MERGSSTHQASGFIFLQFSNGKFVERVKEPTKTSVTRKLTKGKNEGQDVHEELHDAITGRLLDIDQESTDWGDMWKFKIDVSKPGETKVFVLTIPVQYGLGNSILFCLKNMDLNQDVKLSGYHFPHDTKPDEFVQGITVYQSGSSSAKGEVKGDLIKVAKYYTKEHPNGLPEWKKVTVNKKDTYDQTEQLLFIENMVNEEIKPLLPGSSAPVAKTDASASPSTFKEGTVIEDAIVVTDDDLPF